MVLYLADSNELFCLSLENYMKAPILCLESKNRFSHTKHAMIIGARDYSTFIRANETNCCDMP